MPILRMTQAIRRPAHDVFAVIADGGSFASWNPTIRRSRPLTPGAPAEGTQFEWDLSGFGPVRQELKDFDQDRQVRIVPEMRALRGGHLFRLSQVGPDTRVDHELEMTPRGLFIALTPLIWMTGRRNLRATADALKRHLESQVPGSGADELDDP